MACRFLHAVAIVEVKPTMKRSSPQHRFARDVWIMGDHRRDKRALAAVNQSYGVFQIAVAHNR